MRLILLSRGAGVGVPSARGTPPCFARRRSISLPWGCTRKQDTSLLGSLWPSDHILMYGSPRAEPAGGVFLGQEHRAQHLRAVLRIPSAAAPPSFNPVIYTFPCVCLIIAGPGNTAGLNGLLAFPL